MPGTLARQLKRLLVAVLLYAAAALLLIEDWLWDATTRALDRLGTFQLFRQMGTRIAALPPYAALATFSLPFLSLLPIKVVAVFALTKGHIVWGSTIIIAAKIGGTAITAKLYQLTKPSLMRISWLARLLTAFVGWKDRLIAMLKTTHAWHTLERTRSAIHRRWRVLRRCFRIRMGKSRLRRLINKLIARRGKPS